jgi:hypothetical protein
MDYKMHKFIKNLYSILFIILMYPNNYHLYFILYIMRKLHIINKYCPVFREAPAGLLC